MVEYLWRLLVHGNWYLGAWKERWKHFLCLFSDREASDIWKSFQAAKLNCNKGSNGRKKQKAFRRFQNRRWIEVGLAKRTNKPDRSRSFLFTSTTTTTTTSTMRKSSPLFSQKDQNEKKKRPRRAKNVLQQNSKNIFGEKKSRQDAKKLPTDKGNHHRSRFLPKEAKMVSVLLRRNEVKQESMKKPRHVSRFSNWDQAHYEPLVQIS